MRLDSGHSWLFLNTMRFSGNWRTMLAAGPASISTVYCCSGIYLHGPLSFCWLLHRRGCRWSHSLSLLTLNHLCFSLSIFCSVFSSTLVIHSRKRLVCARRSTTAALMRRRGQRKIAVICLIGAVVGHIYTPHATSPAAMLC